MKFRHRLLILATVLGGGAIAFQPTMRVFIERRLSQSMRSDVHIQSSKISLMDSTVAMDNISIRGTDSSRITIEKAAFHFDPSQFLRRNLILDSAIAEGMWIPLAPPTESELPKLAGPGFQFEEPKINFGDDTRSQMMTYTAPLRASVDSEFDAQQKSHIAIGNALDALEQKLDEAVPDESVPNPLRLRFLIEDARKELAILKQSMAEDRVDRKNSDKRFKAAIDNARQNWDSRVRSNINMEAPSAKIVASYLANAALVREFNSLRPLMNMVATPIRASESPKARLAQNEFGTVSTPANHPKIDLASVFPTSTAHPLQISRGIDVPLPGITENAMALRVGRFRGTAMVRSESIENTALNSEYSFDLRLERLSSRLPSSDQTPAKATADIRSPNGSSLIHIESTNGANGASVAETSQPILTTTVVTESASAEHADATTTILNRIDFSIAGDSWTTKIAMNAGRVRCRELFEVNHEWCSAIDEYLSEQAHGDDAPLLEVQFSGMVDESGTIVPGPAKSQMATEGVKEIEQLVTAALDRFSEQKQAIAKQKSENELLSELSLVSKNWDSNAREHAARQIEWDARFDALQTRLYGLNLSGLDRRARR